jgi:hypothetical protein
VKDNVLDKIKELSIKAKEKHTEEVPVNLASEGITALNEAIKTKDQADLFMKRLKALEPEA